jgi:hypothetical protein
MRDDYNHLGEVCESRNQSKGDKFVWEDTTILDSEVLGMNKK